MCLPRISIVTISFNQAEFLPFAIESVLSQDYDNLQYIVVDPGSADGSRDIIHEYSDRIGRVLLDPDHGPADGLNKGFAAADGEIFGYLNADDVLLRGALSKIAPYFIRFPGADVISGHCLIIDRDGNTLRESYSDVFHQTSVLHRAASLMQPSSFFRRSIYENTDGFNVNNRLDWDAELFVDLHAAGATFRLCNEMLSGYRIYPSTVTSERRNRLFLDEASKQLLEQKSGRQWAWYDHLVRWGCLVMKYVSEPRWIRERLLRGRVAGRFDSS